MAETSRVARENEVFEDKQALEDETPDLGRPTPADAVPKPADPRATGDDASDADADLDETLAGGLRHPDRDRF